MDSNNDFIEQLDMVACDKISEIATKILDPQNRILRHGWFILGDSSHSPYWINTYDMCTKLEDEIVYVFKEIMAIDKSSCLAIPWAHETASFSFHLSNKILKCFDFRVGFDPHYTDELDKKIDDFHISDVTVIGDLAVLGNLYTQAVTMLQRRNISVTRVVVVASRPNAILQQSIQAIQNRRIPWTNLLELRLTEDSNLWVFRDLFGKEYGNLSDIFK